MTEWKTIDSAPRDGTRILAFGGGLDRMEIVSYNINVGARDAEYLTLDDADNEAQGYNRPTHWRPLPEPPA